MPADLVAARRRLRVGGGGARINAEMDGREGFADAYGGEIDKFDFLNSVLTHHMNCRTIEWPKTLK